MIKTIQSRIAAKRDTSANWTSLNPVLLNGETIIVDTESGEVREKVGDGTSSYTQLPFQDEVIRNLIAGKVSAQQGTEHAGKVLSVNSEGAVVPVQFFGGTVTQTSQLPSSPAAGTWCVIGNDIFDGAFYTGILSDYFWGGDIFSTGWICIAGLNTTGFVPDEAYIGWSGVNDEDHRSVCVYKTDGTKAGEIWITPPEYPMNFSVEQLGVTSMDDSASFYLGEWLGDTDRFPNKLNCLYNKGDILIWDGSQWNLCQSAANHTANKSNPHNVTKVQLGLSNVSNGSNGANAKATSGFAGGQNATTSSGAALGYNAKTVNASGSAIDAVQLGTGTNETPETLQVYDYQLLDADGKIPSGRLPDTVMTYRGEVISYANLPAAPEKGDVYSVLEYSPTPNASKPCKLITGKVSDLFELHYGGFGTGCHALSIDLINANPDYCFESSENPSNGAPGSHLYKLDGTYIGQIDYSGASNYIFDESCPYAYGPYLEDLDGWDESLYYDSTVSFIMCKTSGLTVYSLETYGIGMVMWDGSSWIRIPPEMGDVEAALDSILAIQNSLIGGGSE